MPKERRGTVSDHDFPGRDARGRPRLAAVLAIVALVVQFVAGFGHFHPDDLQGLASGSRTAVLADAGALTASTSDHHTPGLPTHEQCAICVALSIAGSADLPVPPVLVVDPGISVRTVPRPLTDRRVAWPPHFLFDSRGPPHA
jgi:hypothetical protein